MTVTPSTARNARPNRRYFPHLSYLRSELTHTRRTGWLNLEAKVLGPSLPLDNVEGRPVSIYGIHRPGFHSDISLKPSEALGKGAQQLPK